MVSTLDIVHAGTCGLDDARSFMAEDNRQRQVGPLALHDVPVGVANAARHHLYHDLAGARLAYVQLLDHEGGLGFVEHGGFHGGPPVGCIG